MYRVSKIMADSIHIVQSHIPVIKAAQEMIRLNVGMLVILSNGKISGILTERDITRKIVALGASPESTKVADIMESSIVTLPGDASVIEASNLMMEKHIKYLPIVDDKNEPIGILSMTDIVAFLGNSAEISEIFDEN